MELPQEITKVDSIIAKTKEILTQATVRSTEKLKPFVTLQPYEGQIFACFELFHEQGYWMGYNKFFPKKPDSLNSMDVDWGAMDGTHESFLPELRDFEDELFRNTELTEAEGIDWTRKSEDLLINWFSQCWIAAGGKDSAIPTYFCLGKEYKCHDMTTGEVISEKEAARRAGYIAE